MDVSHRPGETSPVPSSAVATSRSPYAGGFLAAACPNSTTSGLVRSAARGCYARPTPRLRTGRQEVGDDIGQVLFRLSEMIHGKGGNRQLSALKLALRI